METSDPDVQGRAGGRGLRVRGQDEADAITKLDVPVKCITYCNLSRHIGRDRSIDVETRMSIPGKPQDHQFFMFFFGKESSWQFFIFIALFPICLIMLCCSPAGGVETFFTTTLSSSQDLNPHQMQFYPLSSHAATNCVRVRKNRHRHIHLRFFILQLSHGE